MKKFESNIGLTKLAKRNLDAVPAKIPCQKDWERRRAMLAGGMSETELGELIISRILRERAKRSRRQRERYRTDPAYRERILANNRAWYRRTGRPGRKLSP